MGLLILGNPIIRCQHNNDILSCQSEESTKMTSDTFNPPIELKSSQNARTGLKFGLPAQQTPLINRLRVAAIWLVVIMAKIIALAYYFTR
jgi:hypothetical protein